MEITDVVWLESIVEKLEHKHSVQPSEVIEVMEGDPRYRFVERGHRIGENVYVALGRSGSGRYLSVFFIYRLDRQAVILSARDMTQAERRRYERK